MIIHLENSNDFKNLTEKDLVLVDFYADWCGPCQMLAPVLEQLDKESDIKIIKINTDDNGDIAQMFRIMSIPTLLLFKDGKLVNKSLGYMPLDELKQFIKKSLIN